MIYVCVCVPLGFTLCILSGFVVPFFSFFLSESFSVSLKDTLRECRPEEERHCLTYLPWVSPIYFVTFVLIAQFVLVNVVVAVLMKHLEESNKVQ